MLGEHRVGRRRDSPRVALRRVDLDRNELVAELLTQTLEALDRYGSVVGETQPQHALTFGRARLDAREIGVGYGEVASAARGDRERERRLREDRREHAVV